MPYSLQKLKLTQRKVSSSAERRLLNIAHSRSRQESRNSARADLRLNLKKGPLKSADEKHRHVKPHTNREELSQGKQFSLLLLSLDTYTHVNIRNSISHEALVSAFLIVPIYFF